MFRINEKKVIVKSERHISYFDDCFSLVSSLVDTVLHKTLFLKISIDMNDVFYHILRENYCPNGSDLAKQQDADGEMLLILKVC